MSKKFATSPLTPETQTSLLHSTLLIYLGRGQTCCHKIFLYRLVDRLVVLASGRCSSGPSTNGLFVNKHLNAAVLGSPRYRCIACHRRILAK